MARRFMEDDAGDSSRRLSARSRKLTAKAQALSGSRFLPSDSANIPASTKSTDSLPASPNPVPGRLGAESKILETSADEQAASARTGLTYPPSDPDEMGSIATEVEIDQPNVNESSKRFPRRERKPTAKVLGVKPAKVTTAPFRKRSTPPSQEEPRYKMRRKRKPTAKLLDTELDEVRDEYRDEKFDADLIRPKDESRRNARRKSTNDLETSPSQSRHSFPAEDDRAPLISDPAAGEANRRVTRTEENGVGLLKPGRSESSQKKAGAPRHSEPSFGERQLSTVNMSSQSWRKHPKQRTRGRRRAGSAPATPSNARSQIPDIHTTQSDMAKHPKHSPKRRKRENAAARRTDETPVTEIPLPTLAPQPTLSYNMSVEERIDRDAVHEPGLPNSQTRLIVTLPLPTSSVKSSTIFPAQVRKAEFVDKGCQLFCLDASSRILAFAEIAAELPESDDECRDPGATDSSLYEKWLELGRSRFCVCGKSDTSAVRSVLTEDELTKILEPNGITQLKAKDDAHRSSARSPTMSFPRVNTIVKASEGRRVSALYNQVIAGSAPSRHSITQSPASITPPAHPSSVPRRAKLKGPRRSFGMFGPKLDQDGLRKDHNNLLERALVCL